MLSTTLSCARIQQWMLLCRKVPAWPTHAVRRKQCCRATPEQLSEAVSEIVPHARLETVLDLDEALKSRFRQGVCA